MEDGPTSEPDRSLSHTQVAEFRRLYRSIAPSLVVWASIRLPRSLHYRLDPEDLVQETWFRALNSLPSFDATRGSFRAWVFGIATKTLANELRRLHRHGLERLESPEALPEDISTITQRVARREEVQLLLRRVEGLDGVNRDLLLFRGLEGLPYREVSERMGLSVDACEIRWRRLRKQLRDELLPDGLFEA